MANYLAARDQLTRALIAGPVPFILANCAQALGHAQKAEIEKTLGAPVIEINFHAYFALHLPLRPQVLDLLKKITRRLESIGATRLDYLIPPAFPPAAHLLAQLLTQADPANTVGLVWLKRDDSNQTILGGIE